MPDTQITEEMIRIARDAFNNCRPVERTVCQDFGMQQNDILEQQLKAALTAALAGHVVGWRTMDSAPKDGTPILGYSTEGVMYVCWSYKESWVFFENHRGDRWHFYPTHWKPLPAPPVPVERG